MRAWTSLQHGTYAGIFPFVPKLRKVTVILPQALLRKAQRLTKQGITSTVRHGLELLAASETYERARALRGKVRLSIDIDELRQDRP